MTASLSRQSPAADEPPRPPEDRARMIRRRALTLLIIVLLIGVPAGYLVISANQSRDSGEDKQAKYAARGLTYAWPARVQRRIYQVPIPGGSADVAYYETNNWKTSRLYAQFLTNDEGLDTFLANVGVTRDDLKDGDITISAHHQRIVDWDFTGPGPWSGLEHKQKSPAPSQDIVVNWSNSEHPMVYVVSRTNP
ncbi:sugar kinase [Streptomyces sp. NPDC002845]